MGLGKILGSISPAFGLISGKGMFGDMGHMLGSGGGLGGLASMGGLGMLMNLLGGHGGGGDQEQQAPAAQTDVSSLYPGIDPMFTGPSSGGFSMPNGGDFSGPKFGKVGGSYYLGGQNPVGHNAVGQFLGGMFR
jgi:hypothetical protein